MAEQPKTNLYTCWCGKPKNLESWYCKEHSFLEDNLNRACAGVNAEWSNAWGNFSTIPSPKAANQLHDACTELAQAHYSITRVEVLATCINALCRFCAAGDKPNRGGVHVSAQIYCAAYPILNLQPAAAALEALLRKEWNKAIEAAANAAWNFMQGPGMYDDDDVAAEIRALRKEKARATSGGQK